MAVQNFPLHEAMVSQPVDLRITGFRGLESATYPLGVRLEMASEWLIRIIYDPQRFDVGTVIRLLQEFKEMIEQIPTYSQWLLGELPFLKRQETGAAVSFAADDELGEFDFQL